MHKIPIPFLMVLTLAAAAAAADVDAGRPRPAGLRVESLEAPVGLDAAQPRFSWELAGSRRGLRQSAFQILAAGSAAELDAGRGELWDSGKVLSAQSQFVPYAGKPLESNQRCFWKVRFWDERGELSPWSEPACWITGLLNPLGEWRAEWVGLDARPETFPAEAEPFGQRTAQWIAWPGDFKPGQVPTRPGISPEPVICSFKKIFSVKKSRTRRVEIAVQGDETMAVFSQLFVNGLELAQFGHQPRVMDVTAWVREGENIVTVRHATRLLGAIRIDQGEGGVALYPTDESWQACREEIDHWDPAAMAGTQWAGARTVLARPRPPQAVRPTFERALMPPAARLRREFTLRGPVRLAVLHATALGLCDVYLNGRRVGEDRFKPGWLQYDRRIALVTDDVTSHMLPGVNALGAELADGWFAGNVAWFGRNPDVRPRFAAQLHVEYADGSREIIATGPGWKACHGPTRQADLLLGETYDARRETPGWSAPGFDDRAWRPADLGSNVTDNGSPKIIDVTEKLANKTKNDDNLTIIVGNDLGGDPAPGFAKQLRLEYTSGGERRAVIAEEGQILTLPQPEDRPHGRPRVQRALYGRFTSVPLAPCTVAARACPPVRVRGEVPPVRITAPKPGVYVFDFGENLAGWTRLSVRGRAGSRVLVRVAEALRPDGTLDTGNLRSISPADTYILNGKGPEIWEPRFTYHGFRYAQVLGLEEPPTRETLTAVAAGSAGPITSTFRCSSPVINDLYAAICRTQLAGMFEVPANTAARDERLGATGDFGLYLETARYLQRGMDGFAWKYLLDLLDRQSVDGSDQQQGNMGAVAPVPLVIGASGPASLAEGLATVLIPWNLYEFYGDRERVRRVYPALARYMGYVEQTVRDLNDNIVSGAGDSITRDGRLGVPETPQALITRACATLAADRMTTLARECGRPEDARRYRDFAGHLRAAFARQHLADDDRVGSDTQTGYALALDLGLVGERRRAAVAALFVKRVEQDGARPWVGYLGAAHLLPALNAAGCADLACRVIQSKGFPSWGAMLEAGATTLWEGWSLKENVALSRCALGSCGRWLFESLLGFEPAEPGFARLRLRPAIGCGLSFAEGSFESAYGRIAAGWRIEGGRVKLAVTVPANTASEIWLPARTAAGITEGGRPLGEDPMVRLLPSRDGAVVVETGAGEYRFEWPEGNLMVHST